MITKGGKSINIIKFYFYKAAISMKCVLQTHNTRTSQDLI